MCYTQIPRNCLLPESEPQLRESDTHHPHRASSLVGWGLLEILSLEPGSTDKPQPTTCAAPSLIEAKPAATMPYKH